MVRGLRAFSDRWGLSWRGLKILSLVSLISFSTETMIALGLSSTGAFDYYNILFDADSSEGLQVRAHGWAIDDRARVLVPHYYHPLNNYIAMPVIRIAAKAISVVSDSKGEQFQTREAIALLVSPVCMALAVFMIGLALMWLGLATGTAIAASAFYAVSFGSLIFGAVPDHFSMGGMAIAMLMAWFAFWLSSPQPISHSGYFTWALLAVLVAGVTITNILVAFIVLALALARHRPAIDGFVRAGLASAGVLMSVTICAVLLGYLLAASEAKWGIGPPQSATVPPAQTVIDNIKKYSSFDFNSIVSKSAEFGFDSVQAIVSLGVRRDKSLWRQDRVDAIVPIPGDAWSLFDTAIGVILTCMFLLGAYFGLRRQTYEPIRIFSLACAFILSANFLLHSLYGRITFLYSQHWLYPMLFFIVLALDRVSAKREGFTRFSFAAALLVGIAASNLYWVGQTFSMAKAIVVDYRHSTMPTGG